MSPYGGYDGVNEDIHRKVRIKTAGRLQREIKDPEARAGQPESEAIPAPPEVEEQEVQAAGEEPRADERMTVEADQETAEAQQEPEPQAAHEAAQAAHTPPQQPTPDQDQSPPSDAPNAPDAPQAPPLSKLSVEELQEIYLAEIGRQTGSSAKNYLIWKIKQTRKGRIPVGPRRQRTAAAAGPHKVLPLRLEENLVQQLDEARKRLGLKSRMDLFRNALHAFLLEAGEVRVAEMFAPASEA